jgi:hypothetical protein
MSSGREWESVLGIALGCYQCDRACSRVWTRMAEIVPHRSGCEGAHGGGFDDGVFPGMRNLASKHQGGHRKFEVAEHTCSTVSAVPQLNLL